MKRILLLATLLIVSCSSSNQDYWTNQNSATAITGGYDALESNLMYFIENGQPTASQKEELKPVIKTYYNTLLSNSAKHKNNEIKTSVFQQQQSLAYYNLWEGVRSVLGSSQFNLFQEGQNTHYTKTKEKELKSYLRSYNLIE